MSKQKIVLKYISRSKYNVVCIVRVVFLNVGHQISFGVPPKKKQCVAFMHQKNENEYQRIKKLKTLNLKQYFSRLFEQQADISYQLDDICSGGFTILCCTCGRWLYFKETPGADSQIKVWFTESSKVYIMSYCVVWRYHGTRSVCPTVVFSHNTIMSNV